MYLGASPLRGRRYLALPFIFMRRANHHAFFVASRAMLVLSAAELNSQHRNNPPIKRKGRGSFPLPFGVHLSVNDKG